MAQVFNVDATQAGERLDRFLVQRLGVARHQIQKIIKAGGVIVNDDVHPAVHRWLKVGDRLTVALPSAPSVAPSDHHLTIVAETSDYLVVVKPAGVIVHPALGSKAPVLSSLLVERYPELVHIGDASRPGIVHRLDRDVSGLLVVAKTSAMYNALQEQFRTRRVKKLYTALVEGIVAAPEGVLDFPLARSKTYHGRMAARPKGTSGRAAATHFTVVERYRHHTLLHLMLVTGRTHQIRVHLKAFGHHLVGDTLYAPRRPLSSRKVAPVLPRPFLEATTLGFFDLAGQWQEFTLRLDDELQTFLATIA